MKVRPVEGGCWEWQGQLNAYGYGVIEAKQDGISARGLVHRIAFEMVTGELGKDDQIRHMCRNRKCCNPAHLRTRSNYDNVLDREVDAGRMTPQERLRLQALKRKQTAGPNFVDAFGEYQVPIGLRPTTEVQYRTILDLMTKNYTVPEIAKELAVDPMTVKRARRHMRLQTPDTSTVVVTPNGVGVTHGQ